MTAKEMTAIEKLERKMDVLATEIHEYHVTVEKHIERCDGCRADVEQIAADMYGLPGNKEASPGLVGEVAELRRSRKIMLLALRGAWVLLTIVIGAIATAAVRAWACL